MLMLATYDVGNLVGAPAAGAIVHFSSRLGLPAYPTMFVSVAATLAVAGVVYGLSRRRRKRPRVSGRRPSGKRSGRRDAPACVG